MLVSNSYVGNPSEANFASHLRTNESSSSKKRVFVGLERTSLTSN